MDESYSYSWPEKTGDGLTVFYEDMAQSESQAQSNALMVSQSKGSATSSVFKNGQWHYTFFVNGVRTDSRIHTPEAVKENGSTTDA